jgi:hypothetical protein
MPRELVAFGKLQIVDHIDQQQGRLVLVRRIAVEIL